MDPIIITIIILIGLVVIAMIFLWIISVKRNDRNSKIDKNEMPRELKIVDFSPTSR